MTVFAEVLFNDPTQYFLVLTLIIFSVCCHEYAHAQMALWLGDDTGAISGHLTLNPLVQMGPFSLIFCAIFGIAFGQVPVNPSKMRWRCGHAIVAAAGPLMNLLLFFLFTLTSVLLIKYNAKPGASGYFQYAAVMNIVLFILNMLPVPPLDGSALLAYFFPAMERISDSTRNYMFIGIFVLVILFSGLFYFVGAICTGVLFKILAIILGVH